MSTAPPPPVAAVLAMIAEHSGLVFPDLRGATARATIAEFLAERDLRNERDLVTSGQLPALLERLVVHESFFDRDLEQLSFVDDVVLPELGQSRDVPLRVWSAGCAGGEEAYTLAFMLAKRGLFERAAVLGTDLSEAALARARRGRYRAWSARLGPASPAARFLESVDDQFQVPARFVDALKFARLNLVEDPYPGGHHLITCRNVLIYFDPRSVEIVATKLAGALAPGGWIAVGPSDPRLDQAAPLEMIFDERGTFYRLRARTHRRVVLPPVHAFVPDPAPLAAPVPPRARAPLPRVAVLPPVVAEVGEIRRLADIGDATHAQGLLDAALRTRPLDPELHFLFSVLATERDVDAALAALARCVYLDPTKAAPQLLAASLWRARGKRTEARQAYRAALTILARTPATELVPWVDETAGTLITACQRALEILDGPG